MLSGSRTAGLTAGLCPGGRCLYGVQVWSEGRTAGIAAGLCPGGQRLWCASGGEKAGPLALPPG
eukprot:7465664-Pyramimonas_sp.AAC.1